MSSKELGSRTGGKGSWRRKTKKIPSKSQEADKLWLAAQRQGCRDVGEVDTASIIISSQEEALSFSKPELALDMRANTYILRGKAEKKPMVEVLTEMLSSLYPKGSEPKKEEDELGDVENVDFSKADEETKE